MTDSSFQIDETLIGNCDSIHERAIRIADSEREPLGLVLGYLYLHDGPRSITRDHKTRAEPNLTPVELFIFQWLYKRTDGKLRRFYGPDALQAAKRSRFRCEECGFADVRALNLEKIAQDDETDGTRFACLCANCNTVRARVKEMAALVLNRERAAEVAAEAVAAASITANDK